MSLPFAQPLPRALALCEECQRTGTLAMFRSPTTRQIRNFGGVTHSFTVALCVPCAATLGYRRWFA